MAGLSIKSRSLSFLIVFAVYILAFMGGWLVFWITPALNLLFSTLLADLAATLIVWGFGILFSNSSVYDPYWSIAPLIIFPVWLIKGGFPLSANNILFLIALAFWGIRLTVNWAKRWKGLGHQDWRYTMLKAKSPGMWFITNLFGINLMPTIIVFTALLPAYFASGQDRPFNPYIIIWFALCILTVFIQGISDFQMDIFRKQNKDGKEYINSGLWKYSRHPNYLGEISFWWGIWLMQMAIMPESWGTVAGPVLITLLFAAVSIPMMERHVLESKPSYAEYMQSVSVLKLLPRKRLNKEKS